MASCSLVNSGQDDGLLPGHRLNIKTVSPGMEIPILKIRLSDVHLIFIMEIPLLVSYWDNSQMAPWSHEVMFTSHQCIGKLHPVYQSHWMDHGQHLNLKRIWIHQGQFHWTSITKVQLKIPFLQFYPHLQWQMTSSFLLLFHNNSMQTYPYQTQLLQTFKTRTKADI